MEVLRSPWFRLASPLCLVLAGVVLFHIQPVVYGSITILGVVLAVIVIVSNTRTAK